MRHAPSATAMPEKMGGHPKQSGVTEGISSMESEDNTQIGRRTRIEDT
jgi:hypothetical protein